MHWRRTVSLSVGAFAPVTVVALAAQVSLEERAHRLESRLVAPCCFRQVLTMHDTEPAQTMKDEIRRALAAGRSDEEILRGYVDRYGIQILSEPPAVGFHRILSIAPPGALRRRPRGRSRGAPPLAAEDPARVPRGVSA